MKKKQNQKTEKSSSAAQTERALSQPSLLLQRCRHWLRQPELYLVLGILGVALFFRFYNLTNLGLTHFDEGIYTALGSVLYYKPALFYKYCVIDYRYAPPGLPFLIGISLKLFGVKDFITLLPSIVVGSLTVLPLYFLARETDGRETAFWSALLLAVTNYHIVYSRMALTDVPLVFFFLSGLLFGVLAFQHMRWWQFAALGLSTGIAWNVKYNGFIAFVFLLPYWAIVICYEDFLQPLIRKKQNLSAVVLSFLRTRWKFFVGLAAALLITALCYYHWYASVDKAWGYENLTKHHRGYSVPHDQAVRTFLKQPTLFFSYFTHWATIPFYLAPLGIVLAFWRWRKEKILVLLWAIIYYCLLFLYFPYTRLALPIVPALCILAAIALSRLFRAALLFLPLLTKYRNLIKTAAALALIAHAFIHEYPMLSLDTNSYREAARVVVRSAPNKVLVFDDTLRNFHYYIPNSIYLLPQPNTVALLQMAIPKIFIFDLHKTWNQTTPQFLKANMQDMTLIQKIPNRRYDEIICEPANMPKLEQIKEHPEQFDDLLNIYIYRLDKPARIPPEWKY